LIESSVINQSSDMKNVRMQPYSPLWLIWLVFSGIIDPFYGIYCKLASIVWAAKVPAGANTPARRRRGLTIILGGIEGPSAYNLNMARGILKSRYRGAVVRIDWNGGIPFMRSLVNLIHTRHHERQAEAIVNFIRAYRQEHPATPIHIVAQSGGCWLTVRTLELLPDNIRIQTAVLIAPSMSPAYDMSRAANKCDDALISFGSAGDYFFLGMGTFLFGTSDRVFTPSSGLLGWHHQHPKFVDARWHPAWLRLGNLGNHTTSAATLFMQHVVAPRLFTGADSARPDYLQNEPRLTISTTHR
jgi:pimeloyl-ACP methyl ester carboxylesterase